MQQVNNMPISKNITIKKLFVFVLSGGFCFFLYWSIFNYQYKQNKIQTEKDIKEYLSEIYSAERQIIEKIPIYSDYTTVKKEKKLRTYLFKDHIKAAKMIGIGPIKTDKEIDDYFKKGLLTNINDKNNFYYFYGVQKKYRYLTPLTEKGLRLVTEYYQKYLKKNGLNLKVKLAISSALRPCSYQKKLQSQNVNAVVKSTHSYGVSFDIFWDDFFIIFPEINKKDKNINIKKILRKKFGFILGDSLRRQLKSVLAMTLIELQKQGQIYAIMERNQRCFHVTILKKP